MDWLCDVICATRNFGSGFQLMISFVVGVRDRKQNSWMVNELFAIDFNFISNGNVHRKNPWNSGFKSLKFLLLVTSAE